MKFATLLLIFGAALSACTTDPYCGFCNRENVCLGCWNARLNKQHICEPIVQPVKDCAIYLKDNFCAECQMGYALDMNYKCRPINEKINPRCVFKNPEGCLACDTQYYLVNRQCVLDIKMDQNCAAFIENKRCIRCVSGYMLTHFAQCVETTEKLDNCRLAYEDYCLQCDYNYHNINGTCVSLEQKYGLMAPAGLAGEYETLDGASWAGLSSVSSVLSGAKDAADDTTIDVEDDDYPNPGSFFWYQPIHIKSAAIFQALALGFLTLLL
jgi:hypothetical protein